MSKRFGKFLLFSTAVATACATAYYLLSEKDSILDKEEDNEDDFDSYDTDIPYSGSNYVKLTPSDSSSSDDKVEAESDSNDASCENTDSTEVTDPDDSSSDSAEVTGSDNSSANGSATPYDSSVTKVESIS